MDYSSGWVLKSTGVWWLSGGVCLESARPCVDADRSFGSRWPKSGKKLFADEQHIGRSTSSKAERKRAGPERILNLNCSQVRDHGTSPGSTPGHLDRHNNNNRISSGRVAVGSSSVPAAQDNTQVTKPPSGKSVGHHG